MANRYNTEAGRRPALQNMFMVLEELLAGKTLQFSVSREQRVAMRRKGLTNHIDIYVSGWEKDGIIVGYVPVFSEKGRRYYDALRTLYGNSVELE